MSSTAKFDLETFLPYQLAVLATKTSREFAQIYAAEFGLTIPEWRVLAHLSQSQNVSVREIHTRVDMDKSKVTRAVQRLAASKHVKKIQNPKDRRLVSLSLTAKGRNVIRQLAPKADTFAQDLLADLSPAQKDTFRATVAKLIDTHSKTE